MKTKSFFHKYYTYKELATWALSISDDMADVWNALIKEGKHEWLVWTATQSEVFPDAVLRKLACRFVRETPIGGDRTVWDLLTDERSRKAVEIAEAYVDGKATDAELYVAFNAALDPARHAARAAARADSCAAAYAAARAVRAAVYAAYQAAGCAADGATRVGAYARYSAAECATCVGSYDGYTAAVRDAVYAAQARMIAELGNPFKKGETQ